MCAAHNNQGSLTGERRSCKRPSQKQGVYVPTEIDARKEAADFRLIDLGYIRWADGTGQSVTKRELAKLQKNHTWETDF